MQVEVKTCRQVGALKSQVQNCNQIAQCVIGSFLIQKLQIRKWFEKNVSFDFCAKVDVFRRKSLNFRT